MSARLEDSKTGPGTVWLGPEAARLLAALPRSGGSMIREEAGLPGLRIHHCRHVWTSQGIMNGVGLTTIGRLLGHRQRETTAIYAHLEDGTLRDAAAQAAGVIARAMGYRAEPPPGPNEAEDGDTLAVIPEFSRPRRSAAPGGVRKIWLHICVSNGYTTAMATKNAGLRIRVERPLRDMFLDACRSEDKPAAQVIREFMREYIAKRRAEAQGSLFAGEPLKKNR